MVEGETKWLFRAEYLAWAHCRRSPCREPRIFPALQASTIFICRPRSMQQAALPTDTACPWCATLDQLEKGRRERDGAFLQRGAPRDQPALPRQDTLSDPARRSRTQKASRPPTKPCESSATCATPDGQLAPPTGASRRHRHPRAHGVQATWAPDLALPAMTIDETASQLARSGAIRRNDASEFGVAGRGNLSQCLAGIAAGIARWLGSSPSATG